MRDLCCLKTEHCNKIYKFQTIPQQKTKIIHARGTLHEQKQKPANTPLWITYHAFHNHPLPQIKQAPQRQNLLPLRNIFLTRGLHVCTTWVASTTRHVYPFLCNQVGNTMNKVPCSVLRTRRKVSSSFFARLQWPYMYTRILLMRLFSSGGSECRNRWKPRHLDIHRPQRWTKMDFFVSFCFFFQRGVAKGKKKKWMERWKLTPYQPSALAAMQRYCLALEQWSDKNICHLPQL